MAGIDIIYEDEEIIIADKPAGIVVYSDEHHKSGTLLDSLRAKISMRGERAGVVHRLDKDTSGLIIFARNEEAQKALQQKVKDRDIRKVYLALVWGRIEPPKGTIDIPIRRSGKDRKKMEAAHIGRESFTEYEVVKYYDTMTLLKVRIITGRTHQIRVHLAGIGYPVVGDKTYGKKGENIGLTRQFLHAHELGFELFGNKYHFRSDLPGDLKEFLGTL